MTKANSIRNLREIKITLPQVIIDALPEEEHVFLNDDEKMKFVLKLCKINIENETGGPFSAAIFDAKTNRLISVGVNRVVALNNPTAHAEMLAYQFAGNLEETYNLQAEGRKFELFTSGEPCAMCLGATPWAAPTRLVYAATAQDIENIGFNEGRKPDGGVHSLENDQIKVEGPLMQKEAVELLSLYQKKYPIYNGGAGLKE